MGMEPPERMKTVSFLNTSRSAWVAALMKGLFVPTTQAGPVLKTLILVSIPLGVSFFTYFVYFFRTASGSWFGTRRMETLAKARAGITVFAPGAVKPPGMPWTSSVGRAHVRYRTEYPGSPVKTLDPTSVLR